MGRKFNFLIAIFLSILIGWASLVSIGESVPSKINISDKTIHTVSYFLLTLSWLLCFKEESKKIKTSLLLMLIVFIYGIIIEFLQGTVTKNRQPEIYDAIANLIGIIIAGAVFNRVLKKNF